MLFATALLPQRGRLPTATVEARKAGNRVREPRHADVGLDGPGHARVFRRRRAQQLLAALVVGDALRVGGLLMCMQPVSNVHATSK